MSNAIERMALMNATKQNTKFFSLEGQIFEAKIVYIYDGDTMHVVFSLFNKTYKWNCRVMGVDTPEVRTRNLKEKEMGIKVRDILREKLQDKIVKLNVLILINMEDFLLIFVLNLSQVLKCC